MSNRIRISPYLFLNSFFDFRIYKFYISKKMFQALSNPKRTVSSSFRRTLKTLNVAVCGAGVVGSGVLRILNQQRSIFRAQGFDFSVTHVVSRSPISTELLSGHSNVKVNTSIVDVLADDGLDLVVEVMGGESGAARDVVLGAAARGIHVVTANKALLAHALPDIQKSFSGLRKPRLGYEASVAGVIPIIRVLRDGLVSDNITSVQGIMNGTTNFILSAMAAPGGGTFAEELKKAQDAGFAEADATADLEGHDARNKLVLLTRLAFGVMVHPSEVRTIGIQGVSAFDFLCAKELGYTIKLLGRAYTMKDKVIKSTSNKEINSETLIEKREKNRLLLDLAVTPALVPKDSLFGSTNGALNAVIVDGEFSGRTTYTGAGAGSFPTAVSVVSDMISIAQRTMSSSPFPRPKPSAKTGEIIRIASSKIGVSSPLSWLIRGPTKNIVTLKAKSAQYLTRAGFESGNESAIVLGRLSRAALSKIISKVSTTEEGQIQLPFTVYPISN
jgi:homoserine dehydrogenase